jgi:hypothetical protein
MEAAKQSFMGNASVLLTLVALCTIAPGCSMIDQPVQVCLADRQQGDYVISFRSHRGILLSLKLLAPPRESGTNALEIWRGEFRQMIWSIERRTGSPERKIRYGQVPEGWAQVYPPQGQPESLDEGQEYTMTCGLGRGRFRVTAGTIVNLE